MKKNTLLFLSYLNGLPNKDIGGPNHIIYDVVDKNENDSIIFDFVSYNTFIENLKDAQNYNLKEFLSPLKRITEGLYYKNQLFRRLVSSDYYLFVQYYRKQLQTKSKLPNKKYNIVHSHDSIGLSFCSKYTGAKKIMSIHSNQLYSVDLVNSVKNTCIREKLRKRLYEKEMNAYDNADVLTFPSEAVREYYLNAIGVNQVKENKIIYNGVDIEEINKISQIDLKQIFPWITPKTKKIISVASHEPTKRIDLIIDVINCLVYKHKLDILFVNIGEGNITQDLTKKIKKLNLDKNIQLLGKKSHSEVITFLKSCDVFLHLPKRVVFDLVILEALASGLVVCTTNDGGNREIIKDAENGFLFSNDDPSNIAIKLSQIFDYNSIDKVQIAKKFTSAEMAKNYIELYNEI